MKGAGKRALAGTCQTHRDHIRMHVGRLDEAFEALNDRPPGRTLPSMAGIVTEPRRFTDVLLDDELHGPSVIDGGLRLECLELTAYENAVGPVERLDLDDDVLDPRRQQVAEETSVVDEPRTHVPRVVTRLDAEEADGFGLFRSSGGRKLTGVGTALVPNRTDVRPSGAG